MTNKTYVGIIALTAALWMIVFGLAIVMNAQSHNNPAQLAGLVQRQGITEQQGKTTLDLAQASKTQNEGESIKLAALIQVLITLACVTLILMLPGSIIVYLLLKKKK